MNFNFIPIVLAITFGITSLILLSVISLNLEKKEVDFFSVLGNMIGSLLLSCMLLSLLLSPVVPILTLALKIHRIVFIIILCIAILYLIAIPIVAAVKLYDRYTKKEKENDSSEAYLPCFIFLSASIALVSLSIAIKAMISAPF